MSICRKKHATCINEKNKNKKNWKKENCTYDIKRISG